MKQTVNKLPKSNRGVSLSDPHFKVLMEMIERVGCVRIMPPAAGKPSLAIFLESIAEGRLKIVDTELDRLVDLDLDLSSKLRKRLDSDAFRNPLRKQSPMTSTKFLIEETKKYAKQTNQGKKKSD